MTEPDDHHSVSKDLGGMGGLTSSTTCPRCGFAGPATVRFCSNCGLQLIPTYTAISDQVNSQQAQVSMPPGLADKITRIGGTIEGERRSVTVLFADLSGFTTISEKLDPEQVYTFVDSMVKAFLAEIYKHEGTPDKFTGDGVMALFGAPIAHEDDPARAIRVALGMQTALRQLNTDLEEGLGVNLQVRVGLNTGLVVVGRIGSDLRMDYTALGDTVNVASRLQNLAEPGAILVSRPVYEATRPLFEFRELGSIRLRGRVEPVEIYEVVGPRHGAGRLRGIPGLTAPMVGRLDELERLREAADKLLTRGRGSIALVTGDAGMGKSRLTNEFEGYVADKPIRVVKGACLPYGQPAYGVFLQLLRECFQIREEDTEDAIRDKIGQGTLQVLDAQALGQTLPYLERLFSIRRSSESSMDPLTFLEPAQLQQQIFYAVRALLGGLARQRPLVLILEDIHWIDQISLDLLVSLLNLAEFTPLLLHCTARQAEGPGVRRFAKLAAENYAACFLPIPLAPLSQADSMALVDLLLAIPELPESLKTTIPQRAEGNPFYLEETLRMMIDRGILLRSPTGWQLAPEADLTWLEVPPNLQALIMSRVDNVSEPGRYVLQCASVIGREFSTRLLGHVLEAGHFLSEDLAELQDRELIHRLPEGSSEDYRFHHVLIQETVYNSLLLRRRERLHRKIAEGIEALWRDRIEDYTEVLAYHYGESKDTSRALPYLILAGTRAAARFANEEALGYFRRAVEGFARTQATREQRIQVYSGIGAAQTFLGDYDAAVDAYVGALELTRTAHGTPMPRSVAELMRRIGRVYERRGDFDQAHQWLTNALNDLDKDPSAVHAVERIRLYNDMGWVCHRRGEWDESYDWRMRSLQIAEGTTHYNELASAYNGLAVLFRTKGDSSRAIAYAEKGLRLRETIGDTDGVASSHNNLGVLASDQGDWDRALYHYQRALETKRSIGDIEGVSRLTANLADVYRKKGNYARALDLANRSLAIAERIKNTTLICLNLNNLGHLETLTRQLDEATQHLERSLLLAGETGSKEYQAETYRLLANAYLQTEQLDRAEESGQQALLLASQIERRSMEGQALRVLGEIARVRGDRTHAGQLLEHSIAIFAELKNPFELATTQSYRARIYRDEGDLARARALLEGALAVFQQLGAEADRQYALSELESLRVREDDTAPAR